MIPAVAELRQIASNLKLFTPASPQEVELFEVLEQVFRSAYSFVKRRGRLYDKFMVMEAAQEAVYFITHIIYTKLDDVVTKYPDPEERHKFYRMSVGYRLLNYFSLRATSSISYLKKKGVIPEQVELADELLSRPDEKTEAMIALEAACRDEFEKIVTQYYGMGNTVELIAAKCGCSEKRVKKSLMRVKRRLQYPN
jgi:hypothetical protein